VSNYNLVAPLWIGTIFALILAKKIDTKTHAIGLVSALIFVAFSGFGKINILFLIVFLIAAFLDEILSDFAEGKPLLRNPMLKFSKIRINKKIKKILELRPLLEISALIVSFIIWDFSLFVAILFYDGGYSLTNKVGLRLKK
jgi:flagellar biosynthesis protein FlhB